MDEQALSVRNDADPGLAEPEETYTAFEYMKEHTGILVTCVSALVAVVSFIVTLAAFAVQQTYLRVWNVEFQPVSFSAEGQPYYAVLAALLYSMAASFLCNMFERIFLAYYIDTASLQYGRCVSKVLQKENRMQLRKSKRILRKVKKVDGLQYHEFREEIDGLGMELVKCKREQKSIRKELGRANRHRLWGLFSSILLAAIFLTLPLLTFVFSIAGERLSWGILPLWLFLVAEICFAGAMQAKMRRPECAPRNIHKEVAAAAKEREARRKAPPKETAGGEEQKDDDPLVRALQKGRELSDTRLPPLTAKSLCSDKSLRSLAEALLLGVVTLSLALLVTSTLSVSVQKTFWLCSDSGRQYVVAYQDTERCVLKAAVVEGDILTIDTLDQLVLSGGDLAIRRQTFSKVIWLPEKKTPLQMFPLLQKDLAP